MTKAFFVVLLPGDGAGTEVLGSAVRVLEQACAMEALDLRHQTYPFGGAGIDATGYPLPGQTLAACRTADAILLGAVGGPRYDKAAADEGAPRPEEGLLQIRAELELYANLRPSRMFRGLENASPLRHDRIKGLDLLIVRELTGGVYFGEKSEGEESASDLMPYTADEVRRVARIAFGAARDRRGLLTSVDKANVLATSRLWRRTIDEMAPEWPDVRVTHVLVDAMAMHLVTRPADFDVIVTENLFGDILSDEAAAVTGSIGLAPSASVGTPGTPGLFEPVHGSAPDIAGKGIANPIGAILSAALALRHAADCPRGAERIEMAVETVLKDGPWPPDLGGEARTEDITQAVLSALV